MMDAVTRKILYRMENRTAPSVLCLQEVVITATTWAFAVGLYWLMTWVMRALTADDSRWFSTYIHWLFMGFAVACTVLSTLILVLRVTYVVRNGVQMPTR